MKGFMTGLGIMFAVVLGCALLIGGCGVSAYNTVQRQDESCDTEWANVQTALQRRHDLIPNLFETVKGYAAHERETLTEVTKARQQVASINVAEVLGDPEKMKALAAAEQNLTSSLSRLIVTFEKYPDLKANENFLRLQDELVGTENRVKIHRQRFNDAVKRHNSNLRTFPRSLFAGGLSARHYFEADPGADKAPNVSFTTTSAK